MFCKNADNIVSVCRFLCNDDTFGVTKSGRREKEGEKSEHRLASQNFSANMHFYRRLIISCVWFSFIFFSFFLSQEVQKKRTKSFSDKSYDDSAAARPRCTLFWYLFTIFMKILDNLIDKWFTYRYSADKCDHQREGDSWYSVCNVLIPLHWQPMWIIIQIIIIMIIVHVTREFQLPASTKGFMMSGRGTGLYFVYRRIYGELLLIFLM